MATVLAPFGARPIRNLSPGAPTQQANLYWIKSGYATAIGFGDPVITLASSSAGYVGIYANGTSHILGFFGGIALPFQNTNNAFNPVIPGQMNWAGTEVTNADVPCWVFDSTQQVFLMQASGGPILQSDRGTNIDMIVGTPSNGISTAALDAANKNTTSTFPLRIVGIALNAMFGVDPTNPATFSAPSANNLVEVVLNSSEYRQTTGI